MQMPIPEAVRLIAAQEPRARTARLQGLIGKPTPDSAELHWRALLVTALRQAKVWPPEVAA